MTLVLHDNQQRLHWALGQASLLARGNRLDRRPTRGSCATIDSVDCFMGMRRSHEVTQYLAPTGCA